MDVQEIEKVPEAITELQKTTVERRVFHFALGAAASLADLKVVANGQEVALTPHTGTTRSALRSQGTLWQKIDQSHLTHFATVALPRERVLLLSVYGTRRSQTVVVAQAFHAPEQATRALAKAAFEGEGSYRSVAGSPERLAALGLDASQLTSVGEIVELDRIVDTNQTAIALAMFHPNVATIAPTQAAITKSSLGNTPAISGLGTYIQRMQTNGVDYATLVQAENPDGSPAQIKVGSTTTTFSTIQLNKTDPGFVQALRSGLSAAITGVRDNAQLGAVINKPLDQDPAAQTQTWVQPEGVIPQSQPYAGSPQLGAGVDIKVKNPGTLFGTQTVVNGSYSSGLVPLKLYNNYVRWVWVYVQYLGANSENLSANTNPKWPDTKYAQSLGLLPQIFTILGIPLWGTNTIDVTLNFPPGAHTARLLFCGLGSDINGGWRQYFPADAYPDRIAPTDEVLFAAVITGILTIGLTVFALVADGDITATWDGLRAQVAGNPGLVQIAITAVLQDSAGVLTGAESAALAIASGGATYADFKANGWSLSNIWSILESLSSVIPKIIFGPATQGFWFNVATEIIGGFAGSRLAEAIPYIGEVIALIEAVGDAATLAEVCAETIMSPWVIENEVTLTYSATITINHDPADSTFPKTATSWRLEAKVDGAVTLDPITGSINTGGEIQSNPLVLSVTAPFGGSQIQWSVVFLNSNGRQVGTGVSAQYTNNDPANPPSAVAITIQEILLPITASTVFKRADTTGYAAGGYTWSDKITDTGTVLSKGIQQVTGTTVSTLAGVAGLVWEQGNRFYVRGVPVAQNNASTFKLANATNEGYARPPFLLFDAFVKPTDQGNHVLLEPDPTTPAYHVRKVTLDPSTGAPSWDPTVSYGTFLLPVSAAALHSSGRVVAIHTDSGRFGWLKPVATPRPVVAAYSAGHGTQVGLLSSPIALAVTNPGVVLVLEAGASQLAAFDLNGNPVPYFGVSGQGQYTLPLVSKGTYLDLAVDGAGQIYALYYTGDGAAPADYHVDVYTQAGAVLDTQSPGVNVPHLAIDYWRSIYAANYDPLADIASGDPHIDPALTVAEPSLSRFDPTTVSAREPARR